MEAGGTVIYQATVLKLQVEAHLGHQIRPAEPRSSWLIRWAAMAVPRYQIGTYGKAFAIGNKGERVILHVCHFGAWYWSECQR